MGCQQTPVVIRGESISSPIPAGSLLPQMVSLGSGRSVVSWLEPRADKGYRFRASVRLDGRWGTPVTLDDSTSIAMFSDDLPGVAPLPGGSLMAYWERRNGSTADPYATEIQLARSEDLGQTWTPMPSPHRDGTLGQHSFIAAFTQADRLGLVWLDAQKQRFMPGQGPDGKDKRHGAIGLRYASFAPDGRQLDDAVFIDPVTCECCPTAAAVTSRGPVVAYRDRFWPDMPPEEVPHLKDSVRDIHVMRLEQGVWTKPIRVHADNWTINLCPANGPAIDAINEDVVVAWWTAADSNPRVSAAFSSDAGDTFSPPVVVSGKPAAGQVTVVMVDNGRAAIVGWLEEGKAWARWVGRNGRLGEPLALGLAPSRTRLPRWIAEGEVVLAFWTNQTDSERLIQLTQLAW
jgi:hypothetical protein